VERYKRHEEIGTKINTLKLPYEAWKVLFLLNDELDVKTIAAILEMNEAQVLDAVTRLEKENLVSLSIPDEVPQEEPLIEPEEIQEEITEVLAENDGADLFMEAAAEPDGFEAEIEINVAEEEMPASVEFDLAAETPVTETISDFDLFGETVPEPEEIILAEEPAPEPVKPVAAPEPVKPKAEPVQPAVKTNKLLVIDDSIVIRKMVEIALEDEDFSIHTAVNGKDGLSKLDSVKPALVILDLMLPDIGGIELLKTIKASMNIPVIMLSGKDSPQMVEKARSEGADEFLPKPFRDEDLISKIKALLK
jgi:CheY-like chemotaxis protein